MSAATDPPAGVARGSLRGIEDAVRDQSAAGITSVVPGVGATNLGKAEDAPHTSGDVGVFLLAVQQALVASGLAGEGDYAGLQVDGFNLLKVGPDSLAIPSTSVTSAATIFSQDMTGYESISVQVTSAGSGCTITYETSDDNTNWLASGGLTSASTGINAMSSTSTTALLMTFPRKGRYFRARVSTYGSGTVTVVGNLHKNPQPLTNRITTDVVGQVGQGTAISGNPVTIAVEARSANTSVTTNTAVRPTATLTGALVTKPYSIPEADLVASYAAPITFTTSDQEVYAAPAAGLRNYVTEITITAGPTFTANTIRLRSNTTTIWQIDMPNTTAGIYHFTFPTPLKCSAAEALNAIAASAVTGTCKISVAGYVAP